MRRLATRTSLALIALGIALDLAGSPAGEYVATVGSAVWLVWLGWALFDAFARSPEAES